MKKADVMKRFIPITAKDQMDILNKSGIAFVNIRTGNRFHSTRNIKIFDPNVSKANWETAMYAYNKVEDPRYFQGRNLEQSEIYLNPKYRFLLDFSRPLIEVDKDLYTGFISNMENIRDINKHPNDSSIISEYAIYNTRIIKFMNFNSMPVIACKKYINGDYIYFISTEYEIYIKGGYFNG